MTRTLFLAAILGALALSSLAAAFQATGAGDAPPYRNARLAVDERVRDLLGRMTAAEKARMLSGANWMESQPNERLGIPAIRMADGPLGVRNWAGPSAVTNAAGAPAVHSTAFPAGIAMASTWDVELVRAEGRVIAREVKALGRDMILGPTVNIARTPLWGRNFEGYGEDPYLAARMGVAFVQGVQGEGVIPSVKHFVANNQEFERHRIDETIDPRTLHEIYFPAFKAAVQEAGAWTVMSAYNKLNGDWCAESPFLLTDILRKGWGFKGFVISDWGSTYSTARHDQRGHGSRNARRRADARLAGSAPRPGGGQRRGLAHRGQGARGVGLGRGETERCRRRGRSHPARHVHGRALRPAARRRRPGRHPGAARGCARRQLPKAWCC